MRLLTILTVLMLAASGSIFSQSPGSGDDMNWPQWRGPNAGGVVPDGNPPMEWSETKNVKWKVKVPGKGHATPIIWKDQIILLSAVPTDSRVEPEGAGEGDDNGGWM